MIRPTTVLISAASIALLSFAQELRAGTLVDPFTDGALVGGSDNSGLAWFRRSSNQAISIADDSGGINTGNALKLEIPGGSQINRAVLGVFSAFSLVNVGDEITLSFDFRFDALPTVNTADGFRFGLYNSNGTTVTLDGTVSSDNDFGYQVSIGTGSTLGFDLKKETNSGAGGTGSNDPNADRTSISPNVTSQIAINNTLKHTGSFTITRAATGVTLSATVDGTFLGSGTNNTAPFLAFDEVVINHATPQAFRIDNVTVTTQAVPEPGTLTLLGLGLAGLWARRRR